MRAAVIGIIHNIGIAAPNAARTAQTVAGAVFDHAPDARAHAAEMHRNMRRIGDQRSGSIEQRAREIEPFLDVHRTGGGFQHHAHFLGNGHEQIVEDGEPNRINIGSGSRCSFARRSAR